MLFNNLQFNLVLLKKDTIYESITVLIENIKNKKYSIEQDSVEIMEELLNSCNRIKEECEKIKFDEKELVIKLLDEMNNSLEKKINIMQLNLEINNLQFNLVDSKDNQIYKSSSELMKQLINKKYSIDQDSVEIMQELLNLCNKVRVNYKKIKFDEKESVMKLLDEMNNALEKKIRVIQLKLKINIEDTRIKALQQALLGDESKKEIKIKFFNTNPDAKNDLSSQYVLDLAVFNIIEREYRKVDPLIKELGGLVYT